MFELWRNEILAHPEVAVAYRQIIQIYSQQGII